MFTKLLSIVAMFSVASAGLLPVSSARSEEGYDPHPSYTFGYDVQDSETGDIKSQTESRDGDVVQGSYSLNDADGYRRIVEYSADPEHGFSATVRREPLSSAKVSVAVAPKPDIVLKSPIVAAPEPIAPIAPRPKQVHVHQHQPIAVVRSYAAPTTVIHHAPLVHHAPVQLAPAGAHIVHAHAPLVTHHAPVVAHHAPAVVKTSFSSPHVSYVF